MDSFWVAYQFEFFRVFLSFIRRLEISNGYTTSISYGLGGFLGCLDRLKPLLVGDFCAFLKDKKPAAGRLSTDDQILLVVSSAVVAPRRGDVFPFLFHSCASYTVGGADSPLLVVFRPPSNGTIPPFFLFPPLLSGTSYFKLTLVRDISVI